MRGYSLSQGKDTHSNQSREDVHGRSPGKSSKLELQLSSLHGAMDSVTFPGSMCDHLCRVLSTREAYLSI